MSNYRNRHEGHGSHHHQSHRFSSPHHQPANFHFPPHFCPPVNQLPPGWPIPDFSVPPPSDLRQAVHSASSLGPVDQPPAPPGSADSVQEKLKLWMNKYNLHQVSQEKSDELREKKPSLFDVKVMVRKLNVLKLKLSQWPEERGEDTDMTRSGEKQALMQEMEQLLVVLEDDKMKEMVRRKVAAAQQRKNRRQKQRQKWSEKTQSRQEFIERRNKEIDKWLDRIQDSKMMEQMKKAADVSMADVRQKIADVNKQKELILSLTKLRTIRSKSVSTSHGDDEDASFQFNKKTSELLHLLENRLEIYKKEENTLKVLSESEYEEKRSKEARTEAMRMQRKHDKLEKQKEMWLFGHHEISEEIRPFYEYYTQADSNFDSFIRIRHQWDSYVVPGDVPGVRIPRGWVVPSEPSSTLWQQYLSIGDKTPSSTS